MTGNKQIFKSIFFLFPFFIIAQICEPIYTVPKLIHTNGLGAIVKDRVSENLTQGSVYSAQLTVGQPLFSNGVSNTTINSAAIGFWSNYLTEPISPILKASDGDHQDMVLVEWDIQDDLTGPPVTVAEVTLLRNGFSLTTLPISQNEYLDFNVFPGVQYSYEAIVSNNLGSSRGGDDGGFLNPNGVITGQVLTQSQNPVQNTRITLAPNLGRSIQFEGNGYLYWFDTDKNVNRQFSGLEDSYTIQFWFRSVHNVNQTIFAAVDSASTNNFINVEILENGKLQWTHSPDGSESNKKVITSSKSYAGPGQSFHQLSLVFDSEMQGGQMAMYIDGLVEENKKFSSKIDDKAELIIGKRGPQEHTNYYNGYLDDFRIWSKVMTVDDIQGNSSLTLSGEELDLLTYWKFDEVDGDNAFDLSPNKYHGKICEVLRSDVTAPVYVGALTDASGNYAIKSIFYGEGTTFTVSPSRRTVIGRSLKFDGLNDRIDFASQRVDLRGGFTIEGWFKTSSEVEATLFFAEDPASTEGENAQVEFSISPDGPKFSYRGQSINGSSNLVDNKWHHWAVTVSFPDSSETNPAAMAMLIDAEVEAGAVLLQQPLSELSRPGFASDNSLHHFFKGYLDEFRVWSGPRNSDQISGTMNTPLRGDEIGLLNYWNYNDGQSTILIDGGPGQARGDLVGVGGDELEDSWSRDLPLEEVFEHFYEPESRQATLNFSNTSVDLVDFTDKSLIPVSGYITYENTDCVLENVEILMDDESIIPPIYTDATGKYIVDIEPGSIGKRLSAKFKEHEFLPPFIELPMVVSPMTGISFKDKTTYKLEVKVAGGLCELPITPNQNEIKVTVSSSASECFVIELKPDDNTGLAVFENLPPIDYNISVYHPDPSISFDADTVSFSNQLGDERDRSKSFIHRSDPVINFTELPSSKYPAVEAYPLILEESVQYQLKFEVYEPYSNKNVVNKCAVEDYDWVITDEITGGEHSNQEGRVTKDTPQETINFTASKVNLLAGGLHPYQNKLEFYIEDSLGRDTTATMWAFIEGTKAVEGTNFSTTTSKMPWFVLRAPYGDGSYTYLTNEQAICYTTSYSVVNTLSTDNTLTISAGPSYAVAVGMGVATIIEQENTNNIGGGFSLTDTQVSTDETCHCLTTTETYSTSGDGLITGKDATVFIGGGKSVDMGVANKIFYDINGDSVAIEKTMSAKQTGLNSTYIHSRYYIENFLMNVLQEIIDNSTSSEVARSDAQRDKLYWQKILDTEDLALTLFAPILPGQLNITVGEGVDDDNSAISFDAGAAFEYSYEAGTTASNTTEVVFEEAGQIFGQFGVEFGGIGFEASTTNVTTTETTETTATEETKSKTIGFVLDDDDPGDGFAFEMKKDMIWGMPVFVLVGGQSSCPWEEGTVKRQDTQINANLSTLTNVSPGEPAVFTVNLGNNSGTAETQAYTLSVLAESNPYGAVITSSGSNLASGVTYEIDAGESIPISVSIERGPIEYDYENIRLQFAPPCEDDIAGAIGGGTEPQNASFVNLNAYFLKPCSGSNISLPETGWVVSNGNNLSVTMNGYDKTNPNLTTVDLQYRTAGIGDWTTAFSFSSDSLNNLSGDYVIYDWDISPNIIPDGSYDLRSRASCSDGSPAGFSSVVTGVIDRNGPLVFGVPEPIDGILGADDLIRVSFNEDIDCELINLAAEHLNLVNKVTGTNLDFTYTCGANMLTFQPTPSNHYIENITFEAQVNNVSDVYGNQIDAQIKWEFFVNKNPIEWLGTNVSNIILNVEEEFSAQKQLVNTGGSNRSWYMHGGRDISSSAVPYPGNILDIPSWLNFTPSDGTLTPGSSEDITISLAEGLNFGEYKTVLYAGVSGQGDEPMIIDIRKLCDEPAWILEPSDFQYSMNITTMLRTSPSEAVVDTSSDIYDIVGVFVGEELRGFGRVEYIPELESISNFHPYEVFLTVYSNETSGEDLSFKVWDASDCNMLGQINESFSFNANSVEGSITSPELLTATSEIVSEEFLEDGWNWFSLNTDQSDMSTNNILSILSPSANDVIKSQNEYAQYSEISEIWVGGLDSIDHQATYLIKLANKDTLLSVGYPIDVELDTISINTGWTWIGYTPQQSYQVNEALESLNDGSVITGDLIKSQTGYAQYVENFGWFGSLNYMDPGNGYQIYASGTVTTALKQLRYPFVIPGALSIDNNDSEEPDTRSIADNNPLWNVDPYQYSSSMNITGQLKTFDQLSINENDIVGAFLNGECRGVGYQQYIEQLDEFVVFLTVYGNEEEAGDIDFRVYAADTDEILYVPATAPFVVNDIIGNFDDFYTWDARILSSGDPGFLPQVFSLAQNYPNPFNPVTTIGYGIPEQSNVRILIYNVLGEVVKTIVNQRKEPGYYFSSWNGTNDFGASVSAGIYFYEIHANDFVKTRKLLLLK